MDVAAQCAAIRNLTIAQIPGGAEDLDQLVCDGKTLRGAFEPTPGGCSAFIAQVTLYSAALGVDPSARPAMPQERTTSVQCAGSCSASWISTAC